MQQPDRKMVHAGARGEQKSWQAFRENGSRRGITTDWPKVKSRGAGPPFSSCRVCESFQWPSIYCAVGSSAETLGSHAGKRAEPCTGVRKPATGLQAPAMVSVT